MSEKDDVMLRLPDALERGALATYAYSRGETIERAKETWHTVAPFNRDHFRAMALFIIKEALGGGYAVDRVGVQKEAQQETLGGASRQGSQNSKPDAGERGG